MMRLWALSGSTARRTHQLIGARGASTASATKRVPSGKQRGARATLSDAVPESTKSSSSLSSAAAKGPPLTRFSRLVRDKGFAYAFYLYVMGEGLTLIFTYLLHCDALGAGDVISWLRWIGLDRWIDLEKQSGRHVSIFGFELSIRLATNYGIANLMMMPIYPFLIAFCAYTLPTILPVCRALKFWKRKSIEVPKAPSAEAATKMKPSLPK